MHRSRFLAVFLVALGLPVARADEGLEPLERIAAVARAAAAAHTGRAVSDLEVAPLDPRLRLPACAGTPTGRPTPGTRSPAQVTIEVRCATAPWRHFVAVRIHAEEPVVIAAHPLARGQVVAADDLDLVPRDLAQLPGGYFRTAAEVVGQIAQRTVGPGEVLAAGVVRPAPLVHRGQAVTLVVRAGGLNVRAPGIALADAGRDERVRVRNSNTAKQVEGTVRSAETVEVLLE